MGLNLGNLHQMTRPLTHARRTFDQRIKTTALMAIDIILVLINSLGGFVMYLKVAEAKDEPSRCRNRDTLSSSIPTIALFLSMRRARGRPHKGAA